LESKRTRQWERWVAASIIILTALVMIAYYNRWFSFAAQVGPFRIIHYIAFAGTLYVAFGVILFAVFRRRNLQKYNSLLRLHGLGNLLAFLLISMHFAGQVGRPANFYPTFGTGLAFAFYIIIIVHILHGLNII